MILHFTQIWTNLGLFSRLQIESFNSRGCCPLLDDFFELMNQKWGFKEWSKMIIICEKPEELFVSVRQTAIFWCPFAKTLDTAIKKISHFVHLRVTPSKNTLFWIIWITQNLFQLGLFQQPNFKFASRAFSVNQWIAHGFKTKWFHRIKERTNFLKYFATNYIYHFNKLSMNHLQERKRFKGKN